ncbi:hypothetical protein NIES4072_55510 [Nostoc commune NIES-4072]|uniref:Uncharacterized protein n=1 Tax=Nostoc commune NIES-4072 TaxID=2005467 RepID=A0A2R5FSX4_NOSCO|nr:hypothetical protein [Nostoc commune]BBD67156.1 hypothetical protein NIES4070_35440 [Nostoc commune HK-02]GBG21862.1 hypothetical protein NIES4072_55510 [Nostoc commune NIES-4072]
MSFKLSRRQFGQLVLGGTIVSGLSYLSSKTLAQTPSFKIVGIGSGSIITNDQTVSPEVDTTELNSITANVIPTNIKPVGLGLVLESFILQSLNTGRVQLLSPVVTQILAERGTALVQSNETLTSFAVLSDGTIAQIGTALGKVDDILSSLGSLTNGVVLNQAPNQASNQVTPLVETNETLSGFTSLSDGTLVVAATPVTIGSKQATPTRITFLSTPVKTLIISGLRQDQQLGSLLGTNDGRLIGLVGKKNGTPPITLVDIDVQTGEISTISRVRFPSDERASNLAQCPDGKLYTSLVGLNGDTTLVQLDSNQKSPIRLAQLKLNGRAWNNGLQSLVCSGAGQLLAFGAQRYETPNAVYSIDKNSGNMTRLQDFDAAQITLARS